ncbi:MAG TPA: oxygen-independent coproporphyrinogen III oxidase [Rickettsiales bacterium]|nr:oxygen-independent coproporphyrinogen III oxidase [Rickettsiales bacterium]
MEQDSISAILSRYPSQLPRYTSYPAAPHFRAIDPQTYSDAVASLPANKPLSLYLHIPFCAELCWFCGCHTHITKKYEPVRNYLELLLLEIALFAKTSGTRKLNIASIHFGGGSPTMLTPADFNHCMDTIRTHLNIMDDARIAIEIDPRTVGEAKIAAYAKQGVNRVSLGVQDFDPQVQEAINRMQPLATVYETVRLCREYGIHDINFDLIYGLPGQTPESIRKTAQYAALLAPGRIALFGYAHVPWKKKNMFLIPPETLPSDEQRLELHAVAVQTLQNAGYIPIGIDHFALPADPLAKAKQEHTLRRNFQGYTADEAEPLIGFGTSAISMLQQGYFQNTANTQDYAQAINTGTLPVARGFLLNDEDRLRRLLIEEIMCYLTLDLKKTASLPDFPAIRTSLLDLANSGLLRIDGDVITVDERIPQAARIVSSLFDSYHNSGETRHGRVA